MDPKTVPPKADPTKKAKNKSPQKNVRKKLFDKASEAIKHKNLSISEGKKELLQKVTNMVADRVTNNCLSPEGKKNLPKLLESFLDHRIKVCRGEIEGIDPDGELDDLIDVLLSELGLEFIQKLGHSIAEILQ